MNIEIIADNQTNPAELVQLQLGYLEAGWRYAYVEVDLLAFGSGISMCKMYHVFYEGGNFNVSLPDLPKKRRNIWQCIGHLQEVVHDTQLTKDERKAVRLLPSAWRTEDLQRYYPDLTAELHLPRTLKRIVWSLNAYYYSEEILIHPTFDRELSQPEWDSITKSNVDQWIEEQKQNFLAGVWEDQDFEFVYYNKEFKVFDSPGKLKKEFWFPDYLPESEFDKFKGLPFKTVPR